MKKQSENLFPGCSRHCPANHPRCKYGQKYLEKIAKATACHSKDSEKKPRCKWEKHVTPHGLCWQLLWNSRRIKQALRKNKVTEQQLLSALSTQEQVQLCALLAKVTKPLDP